MISSNYLSASFMDIMPTQKLGCTQIENEFESQVNQAFGGFILVLGLDVIYASKNITEQLGISKMCYFYYAQTFNLSI